MMTEKIRIIFLYLMQMFTEKNCNDVAWPERLSVGRLVRQLTRNTSSLEEDRYNSKLICRGCPSFLSRSFHQMKLAFAL